MVATPCRAEELIHAAVSAIRPKADKKKLRIELPASCSQSEQPATQKPSSPDTSDATARFDMKWTIEALVNVLDNAVKYSPEGGTIRIKIDKYEMYLAIHVIDEGHGISEEEIAKVFGRFYRGNAVQQEEGVGIGLYLTREILAKEDGYIKAVPNSERTGGELIIYLRR